MLKRRKKRLAYIIIKKKIEILSNKMGIDKDCCLAQKENQEYCHRLTCWCDFAIEKALCDF